MSFHTKPLDIHREYMYSQVYSEHTLGNIQAEVKDLQKKISKLRAIASFLDLQATDFSQVNCFISHIERFKDNKDDLATIVIRAQTFVGFRICINTKNDLKVQQIACRVHNLSKQRREALVKSLLKVKDVDAHIKYAQIIHRARNFEIRKI